MIPVSVVILAKNEAHIIGATLQSIKTLTDDVIVVDSGSTDNTRNIAVEKGASIIPITWQGFGAAKNKGIAAAKYNWILSIDADEQPDEDLIRSLNAIDLSNENIAYKINFKTFFRKKLIRFGEWGNDAHVRFFHRTKIKWNDAEVHEQLIIPSEIIVKPVKGFINHYTVKDMAEYVSKTTGYAMLSAQRYFKRGKKASFIKRRLSPAFSFINNYIFKLGFLDGKEGFTIARMTMLYTHLKYASLHNLNKKNKTIS